MRVSTLMALGAIFSVIAMGDSPSLFESIMVWPNRGQLQSEVQQLLWMPVTHPYWQSWPDYFNLLQQQKTPWLRLSLEQGAKLLLWMLATEKALFPFCGKKKIRKETYKVGVVSFLWKQKEMIHWWEQTQKQENIRQITALHPYYTLQGGQAIKDTTMNMHMWFVITADAHS